MSTPYMVATAHPSVSPQQLERFAESVRREAVTEVSASGLSVVDDTAATPALLHRVVVGDGVKFAAMCDGDVIGLGHLADAPTGAELWVIVERRWRRRGIGCALAQTVVEHAQRIGHQRIALNSSRRSRAAMTLGQALGFQVIDMGRGRVELLASYAHQGVPA